MLILSVITSAGLPEIKSVKKGVLSPNAPLGYGPSMDQHKVLYGKSYVTQCCTELNKTNAIRLNSHLNEHIHKLITFGPRLITSIRN